MTTTITNPRDAHPSAGAWTPTDEEALLVGMLNHFTPSGEERPLAQWLADQLSAQGLHAEVDAVGNLIATLPATAPEQRATDDADANDSLEPMAPCVLLGHLDTTRGQIPVRREGDLLYGRGAVDAKGPLAAFLAAAVRLAAGGAPRRRDLIVVGAVEEEAATSRGARAVLDRWRPAYTIIGEPSGASAVTLGYKGRLLVEYHVEAPMAHTARPDASVCARAVAFWGALAAAANAWNAQRATDAAFETLAPSLRAIRSESDGLREWCDLTIGYRLPPGCDLDALIANIAALASAAGGRVNFRGAEAAFRGPRQGPLVGAFLRALRAERLTPAFKVKTGTSDMNVVGPVWGCPIVAYGPGDAALDHTPNEHIHLTEYRQGIAVLTRVLADLVAAPAAAAQEYRS